MKRTRKWTFVAQEAVRLAELGLSPKEIAKRLEVNRSTVQRWMAAGKLADKRRASPKRRRRAGSAPAAAEAPSAKPPRTPEEWAKDVRDAFALDATDDQLVSIAESALRTSRDSLQPMTVRLRAASEFRATVKQLALVARSAEVTATPKADAPTRPMRNLPRRSSGDPRAVLVAVK